MAELVRRLDRAWSTLDLTAMAALWDTADPEPWYIPDEMGDPSLRWSDLHRYWQRMSARLGEARVSSEVRALRRIGEDLALAHLEVGWSLRPVEQQEPSTGHSRVLAVLRRTPDGWRFTAWMETSFHRF